MLHVISTLNIDYSLLQLTIETGSLLKGCVNCNFMLKYYIYNVSHNVLHLLPILFEQFYLLLLSNKRGHYLEKIALEALIFCS